MDAVVVGAGFAGLRMLVELRRLGLSARVLEAGSDVGGTWFWNRYPGARTDSELAYLHHVADRFDLRSDIELEARVASAAYDEARATWTVATENGSAYDCTYLVAATGFLSRAYEPPFPGLDDFAGRTFMTARWPAEPVDFTGRRVGVVGTGASGIQVIPEIALEADHLTVFQRTAQYAIPSRNHPLEDRQRRAIKRDYDAIWELCRRQVFAFPIERAHRRFEDVAPDERERILEAGWEAGGFRFVFETFDDVVADARSNEAACAFVRDTPIECVTPAGVRLSDGTEHELDDLVFAVGFDAASGALSAIDVRGRDGRTIAGDWSAGARSYLGLAVDGFPNMFMLTGPHIPLANVPVLVEQQVAWVGRAIAHMREHAIERMEPLPEAVEAFGAKLRELLDATLLTDAADVRSYYLGANIPGKPQSVLFYLGGASRYFREIDAVADRGYDGFALQPAAAGVS